MRRRGVLTTASGLFAGGIAGCLTAPDRGSLEQPTESSTPDIGQGSTTDQATSTSNIGVYTSGSWPQVPYDSRNTRHNPSERGPRHGAKVAWRSLSDRPLHSPVVDGDLYLTESWTEGAALSLSAKTGDMRWSNSDFPPMRWPPALHDGRMFVITRTRENSVSLHSLETATGNQMWVREEGITATSSHYLPPGPTVRDESIYLGSDRGVIACDATTGDIEWSAELGPHVIKTDKSTWRTDWAKPAVTADRVFTFDTNRGNQGPLKVYSVNRSTGDRDWTAELDDDDGWYPIGYVVAGSDLLFVTANKPTIYVEGDPIEVGDGWLFGLDPPSGDVVWDWKRPGRNLSAPAYAAGNVYLSETDPKTDTQRVHALSESDGEVLWTYRAENAFGGIPTLARDVMYIGHGTLLDAVDTTDGTRRWRLDVGLPAGRPAVVGNTIFLQTNPIYDNESRLLAIVET